MGDSLLEKIQEERANDEGLKKSEKRTRDKRRQKVKEIKNHNLPVGFTHSNSSTRSKSSSGPDPVKIGAKYGLFKCGYQEGKHTPPCNGLIIAKDRQKTSYCQKCGKRRRLKSCVVIDTANSKEAIREIMKKEKKKRME